MIVIMRTWRCSAKGDCKHVLLAAEAPDCPEHERKMSLVNLVEQRHPDVDYKQHETEKQHS